MVLEKNATYTVNSVLNKCVGTRGNRTSHATAEQDQETKRLSYFGHVARANGLEKSTMLGMGEGSRGRSRPRMRWWILVMTKLPLAELMDATQDRVRHRRIVMDITRGRPRLDGTR